MNEIVITWWMGLMMASAAVMFAIVGVHKLHEWGICPFRVITIFVRRPWFERLLLLFVICGMVQYGATNCYYFCTTNGQTVTRWIDRMYQIPGSDMLLGRLVSDLPETIHLPKVLGTNSIDSIADCKYLPGVCMNNRKAATILELDSLNCDVTASDEQTYHQMGKTSARNVVSADRAAVWSATQVGNSSSPVFLLAGNDLIFLFSKHLGYKGEGASAETWGPVLSYRMTEVQDKINQWEGADASGYQVNVLKDIATED